MKCLILGDLHIGRNNGGKPAELGKLNSRIQDQVDLLDWAYDQCTQDTSITTIIITGDVYHDFRPYPTIISIFMRWLKKCEHFGIDVHIVMGNHDVIRSGQYIVSALDLVSELELTNATVHKTIDRIELDDFTIVFVPFRDKRMYEVKTTESGIEKLKSELDSVCVIPSNKTKISIGHLAIEGSLCVGDEIADQLNELYVPTDIFEWFDYVFMGHIHHPQIIQHTNPYVAHIGSLDRSDFSKTEIESDKIAILLDSSLENKFIELKLPTRALRSLSIEVPVEKDSTEFVINELCLLSKKYEFKGAIVKLEVKLIGNELENVQRDKIESYLFDRLEIFHLTDFSESRVLSTIQINPEDVFDNTMEIAQTINKWAETRQSFDNDQERELFRAAAHEIRAEYEEKLKK